MWIEYYRIGTLYAFQLFHEEKFEQAFKEFEKFLTDPAEVLCLFQSLSPTRWLITSHKAFTAFAQQHSHFSEPKDFAGVKLKLALHELQHYSTQLRSVFQNISRRSPSQWLEVRNRANKMSFFILCFITLGSILCSRSSDPETCL